MEFRQNVRSLVTKVDVKEADALYDKLDHERKGELDVEV